MREMLLIVIPFLLFSCSSKKRNVFDESAYFLAKTDSIEGMIDKKYFISKYDTTRLMIINYWGDGKILMKRFLHKGRQDGKLQKYKIDGTLFAEDSFSDGKNIYSKKYYIPDTLAKIFKDGKLLPADSVVSYLK